MRISQKIFWNEIAEKFNSASEGDVTFNEELMNCFKNLANRAKNSQAENKKETIKTGGGKKHKWNQ